MKKIIKIIIIIVMVILTIMIIGVIGINILVNKSRGKPCSSCLKSKDVTTIPVPLPQSEDIVRNFFTLINEKKPSDAASMMVADDSEKQEWAVQFNAISSINIIKIEIIDQTNVYKVTMDVTMKPESENATIPYYGWNDGENIRWVTLIKENNLWKVKNIATGP